jgi:uncharacterized protein YjbI with pentapeptide repeats
MTEQAPASKPPDWPTCTTEGCIGIRYEGDTACLAHIAEPGRQAVLAALEPNADMDLRGTPVSRELLDQILHAVRDGKHRSRLRSVRFDRAMFSDEVSFRGVRFYSNVSFREVRFCEGVLFTQAQFFGYAQFDDAQFFDFARFDEARFRDGASFRNVKFLGTARFEHAKLSGASATFP